MKKGTKLGTIHSPMTSGGIDHNEVLLRS